MGKKQFGISDNNYNIPATGKETFRASRTESKQQSSCSREKPRNIILTLWMLVKKINSAYQIIITIFRHHQGRNPLGLPAPLSTTAGSATQGASGSVAGSATTSWRKCRYSRYPVSIKPVLSVRVTGAGGAQPNGGVKVTFNTYCKRSSSATVQQDRGTSHTLGLPASVLWQHQGATGAGAGDGRRSLQKRTKSRFNFNRQVYGNILKVLLQKVKVFLKQAKGNLL